VFPDVLKEGVAFILKGGGMDLSALEDEGTVLF
jgi:hypothetical protein